MFKLCNCVFIFKLLFSSSVCYQISRNYQVDRNIPKDFIFGVSTSAYQIEGAWNISGKTESIWDQFTHKVPSPIRDGSTGDVAADSYHFYKDDVDLIDKLGVQFYRFSVSWSRILPTGFSNYVNRAGVEYYNNLINELLAKNIEPMVTMYHFDLPLPLQKLGGWTNRLMAQYYEDYARVLFDEFGDRVKYWITVNEPTIECFYGYGRNFFPPKVNLETISEYLCVHNQLLAHANAYHLYKKSYDVHRTGKISLSQQLIGAIADIGTADPDFVLNFMGGLVLHPIFSETGDYPSEVKKMIRNRSLSEGHFRSRLPEFTSGEIEQLRGSADFLALNHYTSRKYYPFAEGEAKVSTFMSHVDLGLKDVIDPCWERVGAAWFAVYPQGLREILNWIKNSYNNPMVIITESGMSLKSEGELLLDEQRVNYFTSYLSTVLDAIYEDGCNVQGYTAWSLLDSFEWRGGYVNSFGLHCVNFTSPSKTRVRKMSAFVYEDIVRSRTLKASYDQFIRLHANETVGRCRS